MNLVAVMLGKKDLARIPRWSIDSQRDGNGRSAEDPADHPPPAHHVAAKRGLR